MTSLTFSKMHGLGNDFMVVDRITQPVTLEPQQSRRSADRNTGATGLDVQPLGPSSFEPADD